VIADDGLQHLRLARDFEIALLDAARGLGNGALLPAGPLRESPARLGSVGAVVLTGAGAYQHPGALRMQLRTAQLLPLNGAGPVVPLAAFRARRVHAFAGIGNPQRFFASLRAAGLELIEHPLPDHQAIANQALHPADGLPVLMTEKDAVKCAAPAPANCWYLPVTAQLAADDAQALLRRILMDARLLDILACPVCKGPLRLASEPGGALLVCRADRLGFPVRDGIPVMLEEEARVLEAGDPLLER
jgi:tetraacyldisaccharide 4'-kinase